MLKICHIIIISTLSFIMVGCVTQHYEGNAETPVIENTSTKTEIALTRISLGLGYLNIGNTTQAKLNLEKAKGVAPNLTQVYTAFAQYYDIVDEPEQAVLAFKHALSIDVDDPDTLNNYGVFLCKRKKYDESETVMLKAIAVPSYLLVSQSYENLALCQLENKKFEKAEMYLAKAISHSPSRPSALLQMLRLQYAMGNYEETIVYLRRYEQSARRFTPSTLALAYKTYEKMNNRQLAKNYAGMLVKMFPNSYESNQYILNSLQHIEADDLAAEFLLYNGKRNKTQKRIMVLSPNKKSGISLSSENKPVNTLKVENVDKPTTDSTVVKPNIMLSDNETKALNNPFVSTLEKEKEKTNDVKNEELVNATVVDEIQSVEEKDKQATMLNKLETASPQVSPDEQTNRVLNVPVHVIASGDTLYSLSKKHNITISQIELWNGFLRSDILDIGDTIYLADPKN